MEDEMYKIPPLMQEEAVTGMGKKGDNSRG